MSYRLYGAPAPFETESPNSWLQRVAHRYDLSFRELQEAVGVSWETDIDTSLSREDYGLITMACCRPVFETNLMYSVFCLGGSAAFARSDAKGRPLYNFCIGCLQEDLTPYLRIEWRLDVWTVCPKHLCRMQDRCGSCGRPWRMDRAVLRERQSRASSLAHCQSCGQDQRKFICEAPSDDLSDDAEVGRAVVSALANRHAVICRGQLRTRVPVEYVLSLLRRSRAKVGGITEDRFVNLLIDRTTTMGIERRLALQRMGAQPAPPARLAVTFACYDTAR